MAGETTLTIIGNLTADPELRSISTGASVCNFTIASTPRVFDRRSGQWEDGQPLFMRCSAWRELADHCAQYLSKGMRVIAQGVLRQRSYQANDGTNRTVVELQVEDIGPSLRYAKAAVVRTTQGRASYGAPAGPAQPSSSSDGWRPASPPDDDPWGAPPPSQSEADFGGDADQPEF